MATTIRLTAEQESWLTAPVADDVLSQAEHDERNKLRIADLER